MKFFRISFLCVCLSVMEVVAACETNFIAFDLNAEKVVMEEGPSLDQRFSPCSTFKIALSAIGYDLELLQDELHPVWEYDGSQVFFESQKGSQSPKTWMEFSVVWYSKHLIRKIGKERLQKYVSLFAYGNQDIRGDSIEDGFITAHLCSSLKISPREQIFFLQKFLNNQLSISAHARRMTEAIIPNQSLSNGWRLFGKAGSGFIGDEMHKTAWYVGWIQKGDQKYLFALFLSDLKAFPTWDERKSLAEENFLIKLASAYILKYWTVLYLVKDVFIA